MIAFVAATHGEQTRHWTCPISITPRQRLPMKGMMLYLDNLKDSQWMGWCILYISSPMSLSIKYTVIKTIKRIMQVFIIIQESFNLSCPINLILKSTKLLQTCFPPKSFLTSESTRLSSAAAKWQHNSMNTVHKHKQLRRDDSWERKYTPTVYLMQVTHWYISLKMF